MTHQQKIQWLKLPARLFPIKKLMKFPVIFPFWHTVSNEKLPHIESLYTVYTKNQFETSLNYLLKHFIPLSIDDVVKQNFKKGKRYMHISFDDGLLGVYQNAAPILKAKGIPASFYINPPFINDASYMFRYEISFLIHKIKTSSLSLEVKKQYTQTLLNCRTLDTKLKHEIENQLNQALDFPVQRIYMSESEIQNLYDNDFHIGSHSMTHPIFANISQEEQQKEIKDSLNFIHQKWSSNIRSFAFPYTDDGVSTNNLKTLHQTNNLHISFGTAGYGKSHKIPHFQRIPMEHSKIFPSIDIIKSELFASFLKQKQR